MAVLPLMMQQDEEESHPEAQAEQVAERADSDAAKVGTTSRHPAPVAHQNGYEVHFVEAGSREPVLIDTVLRINSNGGYQAIEKPSGFITAMASDYLYVQSNAHASAWIDLSAIRTPTYEVGHELELPLWRDYDIRLSAQDPLGLPVSGVPAALHFSERRENGMERDVTRAFSIGMHRLLLSDEEDGAQFFRAEQSGFLLEPGSELIAILEHAKVDERVAFTRKLGELIGYAQDVGVEPEPGYLHSAYLGIDRVTGAAGVITWQNLPVCGRMSWVETTRTGTFTILNPHSSESDASSSAPMRGVHSSSFKSSGEDYLLGLTIFRGTTLSGRLGGATPRFAADVGAEPARPLITLFAYSAQTTTNSKPRASMEPEQIAQANDDGTFVFEDVVPGRKKLTCAWSAGGIVNVVSAVLDTASGESRDLGIMNPVPGSLVKIEIDLPGTFLSRMSQEEIQRIHYPMIVRRKSPPGSGESFLLYPYFRMVIVGETAKYVRGLENGNWAVRLLQPFSVSSGTERATELVVPDGLVEFTLAAEVDSTVVIKFIE